MLRIFLLIFFLLTTMFGAEVEVKRWLRGETFLTFLERLDLPTKPLYYNLDKDDQLLTKEMYPGVHYQILRDEKTKQIEQILLPLNSELQIHIYKDKKSNKYKFEAIPIVVETKNESFMLTITSSPMYNIMKETGSKKIAKIFVSSFKKSLNFKSHVRKGDRLVMIYEQTYRLGNRFSMPILKAAMIELGGKKHYIYRNYDDRYYDEKGYKTEGFLLSMPVKGARVSSPFTKRRWHPILHRWKAHTGVDLAVRRGTPIHAAGSGRITFIGRNGGYGNFIKIYHGNGYDTRYAHMKSFRKGLKRGSYVKKGQVIGYVGTTGRSTGPHLHFELRKNNVALNPLNVVQVSKKRLTGMRLREFLDLADEYNQEIDYTLENKIKYQKLQKVKRKCYFVNLK